MGKSTDEIDESISIIVDQYELIINHVVLGYPIFRGTPCTSRSFQLTFGSELLTLIPRAAVKWSAANSHCLPNPPAGSKSSDVLCVGYSVLCFADQVWHTSWGAQHLQENVISREAIVVAFQHVQACSARSLKSLPIQINSSDYYHQFHSRLVRPSDG